MSTIAAGQDILDSHMRSISRGFPWGETWKTRLDTLAVVGDHGGSLVHDGRNKIFCALSGVAGSRTFDMYDINENTWAAKALLPVACEMGAGGQLAYDGDDKIYATSGFATKKFQVYTISTDAWAALTDSNLDIGVGGSLCWGGGDYLYAFIGFNGGGVPLPDMERYSITGNSWASGTVADAPENVGAGSAMVFDGDNYIYAFTGNGSLNFYRYDITADTWTALTATDSAPGNGSRLAYDNGNFIYATHGADKIRRYDIAGDAWETLTVLPASIGRGSGIVFVSPAFLYATRGGNTANFYRYII